MASAPVDSEHEPVVHPEVPPEMEIATILENFSKNHADRCFERNIMKKITTSVMYHEKITKKIQKIDSRFEKDKKTHFTIRQMFDHMMTLPRNIIESSVGSSIPIQIAWSNLTKLWKFSKNDKYYEKYEKTLMFLCFLNEHDATGRGIQFINDNRIVFMNQKYTDKMKEEMKEYWSNPISQIEGKLKCHGFKVIRKGIKLTICHRINGRENPVSDDNDDNDEDYIEVEEPETVVHERPAKKKRTS
jgi:hypothetical protein